MRSNIECTSCSGELTAKYSPINTKRGIKVYSCTNCGLMQSFGGVYVSRPKGSMSCDADRASIKYTKTLVLQDQIDWLTGKNINFSKFQRVLDIGANRGSFMTYFFNQNDSFLDYHAVETEPLFEDLYPAHPNLRVEIDRIENVSLRKYDFVYFIHTLEHLVDVSGTLNKLKASLTDDGVMYICVPNIIFGAYSSFSEIFIDPHTIHFEYATLYNTIVREGFEIIASNGLGEPELKMLVKRSPKVKLSRKRMLPDFNMDFYKESLKNLRQQITLKAKTINELEEKRIFWGAGRIFDGLVRIGDIEFRPTDLIIDKNVSSHFPRLFDNEVRTPECLLELSPDEYRVIICSNEYANEIKNEAKQYKLNKFIEL